MGKYCKYCLGKGYIDGLEKGCPGCNPGGEWRSVHYFDYCGDDDDDCSKPDEKQEGVL